MVVVGLNAMEMFTLAVNKSYESVCAEGCTSFAMLASDFIVSSSSQQTNGQKIRASPAIMSDRPVNYESTGIEKYIMSDFDQWLLVMANQYKT